ncbi:MAG: DUF2203 domain-containing protein [Deltaproteobacteria bacterium]|nr:DUF2203 domain-containing protein [Deltaproteobacteria bacterium]
MPVFDLAAARRLVPQLRAITEAALREWAACEARIEAAVDGGAPRPDAERALERIVLEWTRRVTDLGAVAKGLWLVDFDNGDGYYCWRYPETTVEYCHGHHEGFAGRRPIAPESLN